MEEGRGGEGRSDGGTEWCGRGTVVVSDFPSVHHSVPHCSLTSHSLTQSLTTQYSIPHHSVSRHSVLHPSPLSPHYSVATTQFAPLRSRIPSGTSSPRVSCDSALTTHPSPLSSSPLSNRSVLRHSASHHSVPHHSVRHGQNRKTFRAEGHRIGERELFGILCF